MIEHKIKIGKEIYTLAIGFVDRKTGEVTENYTQESVRKNLDMFASSFGYYRCDEKVEMLLTDQKTIH